MRVIKNNLDVFKKYSVLQSSLTETQKYYRPYDPGSYLYNLLLKYDYKKKFSDEFIELVYVTLSAWNMNSRGAKLNDIKVFKTSIIQSKAFFDKIRNETISNLSNNKSVEKYLFELFQNIKLVYLNKPPLVTFSKTMHFFLPELIVPIDREYTLNYFYGNINVPKEKEKQFKMFIDIESMYSDYANEHNLEIYIDNIWNRSIPKVLDNMVIGYLRKKERRRTTAST